MKLSLKELIDQIEPQDLTQYKRFTPLYIEEALKGRNWDEWNPDVFQDYFEKSSNSVAYLGQGVFKPRHKEMIKRNWMKLASHLQAIASSQDEPLWNEYKQIKTIIRGCIEDNMQVATNRMMAGLQPKLLCTEVDLKKVNELIDYIHTYTNAEIPAYDRKSWESASYHLLTLLHSLYPDKNHLDFAYIPWKLLELFRNKIEKEHVTYWIIPSKDSVFRIADCLKDKQFVDWQSNFNPKKGDVVFIYRSRPMQRISYMTEVTETNIPYRNTINDEEYWGEEHCPKNEIDPNEPYQRLKLIKESESTSLQLTELNKAGLNGAPRGPRRIFGKTLEYVLSVFQNQPHDYDEIINPDDIYEGAKKTVVVNSYERDGKAREICIAAHGCRCSACGMDFEETYGNIGRGFIHVHHIVPISTIGAEYKLDPVKDLVPVCPNCHAMLHRDGIRKTLTIEELKEYISSGQLK